ncbi:hypothetical protein N8510_03485, partial [bacterium]|nr:hypothetical protein [bacterium]
MFKLATPRRFCHPFLPSYVMMQTSTTQIDIPGHQQGGFCFLVAAFCFVLVLVNYLDRVVISFAIKPIESDLSIQDGAFGLLMSA